MTPPLHTIGRDCTAEFESAAASRHTEARDLLRRSRDLGATYLYRYSIELRWKAADFATLGVVSAAGVQFWITVEPEPYTSGKPVVSCAGPPPTPPRTNR